MKSSFSLSRSSGFIEPLESRVAPAAINIGYPVGAPNPPAGEAQYDTVPANPTSLHFVATFNSLTGLAASDPISQAVDDPGVENTYYIVLHKGDTVNAYNLSQGTNSTLIKIVSGNVVAFFTDLNNDDIYQAGELTGLALGKNASVQLGGQVNGDVVTALNDSSKIASNYTIDTAHLVSNKQGIANLVESAGSIAGDVLSGGNISKLTISQNVYSVLAGTAAQGAAFDFFKIADPSNPGQFLAKRFTVDFTEPAGQPGASISDATIQSLGEAPGGLVTAFVPGVLQAGDGGSGAKGGSLSNVWINGDGNAFSLLAGNGGDGILGKAAGGAGGLLQHITVSGVVGSTINAQVDIEAGHGGAGFGTAAGGLGGSATNVYVGYDLFANAPVNSTNLSASNVLVEAGAGGNGQTGGKGGLLSNINVRVSTPADAGDELSLIAGAGGNATSLLAGKAGVGGGLQKLQILNEISTAGSDILLQAGDGGTAGGLALGAAGGAISTATILGYDFEALAGNGSSGKTGGAGGSITGISLIQGVGILNQEATFNSGFGGDGTTGSGGKGGAVSKVNVPIADYTAFLVNTGTQGDGGNSTGGKGGAGGSVSAIIVQDIDGDPGNIAATLTGVATIRSGDGGDGAKGGGVGGPLGGSASAGILFTSFGLTLNATAGLGGNATVSGPGGAGGTVRGLNVTVLDNADLTDQNGLDVTASVTSGTGGDGMVKGKGGAGGGIGFVNLDTDGEATLIAGNGGNGQVATASLKGSAAGAGGSITTSGAFANNAGGLIEAGNAGANGVGAAVGGSLIGGKTVSSLVGLRAETDLVLMAGNGSGGGAGGDIINATYGSTALSLSPTPSGNIIVQAGNGSGAGKIAGRGGLINNLSGTVTSGPGALTTIQAGTGGSTDTASGAGGSVSDVTILGGGAAQAIFTVSAGDAGNAPDGKVGAAGGSVNGVQVSNLDATVQINTIADFANLTIFRSVAAGNGGDASPTNGKGGVGGSINGVFVAAHDIGIRTGAVFGYDSAGGLFAGVGGSGLKSGLNGSVTNVQANAIASIVAGRTLTPQQAQNVNHIYVSDNSVLLTQQSLVQPGAFTLSFGGSSTPLLPAGATTGQIAIALNQLATIQATGPGGTGGTVSVSYGSTPGTYIILFGTTGVQTTVVTGVEQIPGTATEVIQGATPNVPVTETTMGTQTLPVTITQNGQYNLSIAQTLPGQVLFIATETVQGNVVSGVDQVESIDLRDVLSVPSSTFSLAFDGSSTGNLPTATSANAGAISVALNALPSIMAVGGVTVTANKSVPGTFLITFAQPGQVDNITGTKLFPEAQQLNLGAVTNSVNGSFTLSFGADQTGTLLANSSAATIASALNNLADMPAGGVAVTAGATPGTFSIVFQSNGQEPLFTGVGNVSEGQTLDFSSVQSSASAGGDVILSFNGQATAPLPVNATAAQVSAALNGLSNVSAPAVGGVTVSQTAPHVFSVIFGATGEEPAIVASGNVPEVQAVDVSSVDHVATGQYALSFGGSTTPFLAGNATAAQIQSALNALPSIQGTGAGGTGGAVTVATAGPDHFSITFNTVGEEALITGAGQINEVEQVQVFASKVTTVGQFTLSFDGQTTGTLNGGASASDVQTALNGLSSIPPGGVTVTNGANGIYTVTFNQPGGPIDPITSLQLEPMNTSTTGGTGSIALQETISVVAKGAFDPVKFAHADLVGSIYNINAIDANVFHYLTPGSTIPVTSTPSSSFVIGDTPIDGIVLAHNLDQSTINFTPEAELTDAGFFDYLNQ